MYSDGSDSGWVFVMICAIIGFFGSIAGIGCLIYWLFKHVAIVEGRNEIILDNSTAKSHSRTAG